MADEQGRGGTADTDFEDVIGAERWGESEQGRGLARVMADALQLAYVEGMKAARAAATPAVGGGDAGSQKRPVTEQQRAALRAAGRSGGRARAGMLTPERRREIATQASRAARAARRARVGGAGR